ncbi:hypothetical protein BCR44DRAFT_1441699 [Catenaria anguillulae PL171]|uniref:Uncharacterized protein n=1 Tax=Catenaria anguillulae PL171 TaxID=765915 RepID=A0A1Y2HAP7_9FUNG|nr:hypothetical protein BCR44DRAFT_1441699 [Catenaria anguillulae PL171]
MSISNEEDADDRCDSGLDASEQGNTNQPATRTRTRRRRPWTCIKVFDFAGYPGADLTSLGLCSTPQNPWTLTPAQSKLVVRVLDALLHHLCPAAVGLANASSYSCTPAQAWAQPALFRFLQLPGLREDMRSVAPDKMHEVIWGKADAGRIERCEEGNESMLEALIAQRMRELADRQEQQQWEDEWSDSGDDLPLSDRGDDEHEDEGDGGYEIAYGVSDNGPLWSQGGAWGQEEQVDGEWDGGEAENVNWAK